MVYVQWMAKYDFRSQSLNFYSLQSNCEWWNTLFFQLNQTNLLNIRDICHMFQESNGISSVGHDDRVKGHCLPNINELLKLQDSEDDRFGLEDEFDDCDVGDGIDPEIKEQIDRYVVKLRIFVSWIW